MKDKIEKYWDSIANNWIEKLDTLLTGVQIAKLLGISRSYFWQVKQRKGFPVPVFKQGRIELWDKQEIEEFARGWKKSI